MAGGASGREAEGRLVGGSRVAAAALVAMRPEPEVQFRPEANASYERSAEVLLIVKQSRVSNFGFLGNEEFRVFGKP